MLNHLQAAGVLPRAAAPLRALALVKLDRRHFLMGAGAGLAAVAAPAGAFEPWPTGGPDMDHGLVSDPLVFVSLDPDGTVRIVAHRSEMGTGIKTSLPMVVADEMGADWDRVVIAQAPGDEPRYGNQNTDGSRSMRHHIQTMREMGAAVRRMLAEAAAEAAGVDVASVTVGVHEVSAGGRRFGFGDLAEAAMARPVPPREALDFRDEADFRYIGKDVVRIADLRDITTGAAVYGADVRLPGMRYAVIARPPVAGGSVAALDAADALAMPGVVAVERLQGAALPGGFAPLGGVAVIADTTWAALEGREALRIDWDRGPHAVYDSETFRAEMEATAEAGGTVLRDRGDWDAARATAATVLTRTYHQAHMAHATMEPPCATARVTEGRAEIWAPVQSPYQARKDIAAALGMDLEAVTVNVTLLGGGFGRKSKADFATEAALLSQRLGAPVQVQWTREDDIRNGYLHTTSVERIEAALDGEGRVTGWRHVSVAPTILSTFAPDATQQMGLESGMGHVDVPFATPNLRCENGPAPSHARIGWWRAVSHIPRAFAIQSMVAEIAHETGRDQREMLLEMIGPDREIDYAAEGLAEPAWNHGEPESEFPTDTARLKAVLNMAADAAGWGAALPQGEGLGLAVHRSFVSYIAAAARVRIVDGRITVPEVHMAVDCGFAANPERIRSQMEGSAVMGMTATLHSAVTFRDGEAEQSNFNDYPMVRSGNFPRRVHVHLVPHPFSTRPTGVGEPGVPPIPPAIVNAVFNATGRRLRSLPVGETV